MYRAFHLAGIVLERAFSRSKGLPFHPCNRRVQPASLRRFAEEVVYFARKSIFALSSSFFVARGSENLFAEDLKERLALVLEQLARGIFTERQTS